VTAVFAAITNALAEDDKYNDDDNESLIGII